MAEKEKTARSTSALTCLEDHVSVELGTQALVKVGKVVDPPVLIEVSKVVDHVKRHLHLLPDDLDVFILIDIELMASGPPWFDPVLLSKVLVARGVPVAIVLDLNLEKGQFCLILIHFHPHLPQLIPHTFRLAQGDVAELSNAFED